MVEALPSRRRPLKPNPQRKGVAKSRAGCTTCKIRHIKCDETRPSCNRCSATGRICDFLNSHSSSNSSRLKSSQSSRSPRASRRDLLPAAPSRELQLQPKPTYSISTPFDVRETALLGFFRLACTKSFTKYFKNSLWTDLILRVSHSEPSIRSAVVALAGLLQHQLSYSEAAIAIDRQEPAHSYSHALHTLNRRLDDSAASWELALIGSFLFTAFEALGGQGSAALKHLDSGFAILREYISKSPNPSRNLRELAGAFSRYGIQASTFSRSYRPKPLGAPLVCPSFTNIDEAREALDRIVAHMHSVTKPHGESQRTLPYAPLPLALRKQVSHVQKLLDQWLSILNNTSLSKETHAGHSITLPMKVLQIQHLSATIHISTIFYRDQLAYDAFISEFSQIVALASSVIEALLADKGVPMFSFDLGIIQPLYFTASKCRDPVLRRRAISLLTRSGVEGVWDGVTMAVTAQWVMDREESASRKTNDKDADIFIPEAQRLREVSMLPDRRMKIARLASTTRAPDGEFHYIASTISWVHRLGINTVGEYQIVEDDEDELAICVNRWRSHIEGS